MQAKSKIDDFGWIWILLFGWRCRWKVRIVTILLPNKSNSLCIQSFIWWRGSLGLFICFRKDFLVGQNWVFSRFSSITSCPYFGRRRHRHNLLFLSYGSEQILHIFWIQIISLRLAIRTAFTYPILLIYVFKFLRFINFNLLVKEL